MIQVGVKYCGGCNSSFPRGEFVKCAAQEYAKTAVFELAKEDKVYDRLLVVCGCESACANYANLQYKQEPIIIWDKDQKHKLHCLKDE